MSTDARRPRLAVLTGAKGFGRSTDWERVVAVVSAAEALAGGCAPVALAKICERHQKQQKYI